MAFLARRVGPDALAALRALLVDVAADGGGADELDGLDVRCSTIAVTASRPPYTTLKMPSGRPASVHSSAWSWVAPGVWDEGFKTTVLPHVRAIG